MKQKFIFLFLCLFEVFLLKAQPVTRNFSTIGREFLVSFGQNSSFQPTENQQMLSLRIRIVSPKATTVNFYFNENPSASYVLNVPAGVTTETISMENKALVYSNRYWNGNNTSSANITYAGQPYSITSNRSLRVTSGVPISLYAMNAGYGSSDATNVLPIDNLGTTYYHISYPAASHWQDGGAGSSKPYYYDESNFDGYTIVARDNGTTVTAKINGTIQDISLNAGQVFSYYTARRGSLSGEIITANKPIAYFVTNSGARIPSNADPDIFTDGLDTYGTSECLYQQLAAVSAWGRKFVIPVSTREKERVRIMASESTTTLKLNGSATLPDGVSYPKDGIDSRAKRSLTLAKGEYVDLDITKGFYLEASMPVGVCTIFMGNKYLSSEEGLDQNHEPKGDPAMAWIPALEQSIEATTVAGFELLRGKDTDMYKAVVIVPTSEILSTTVTVNNGAPQLLALESAYNHVPGASHSYYSYDLDAESSYTFESPKGLIVLGYGYGGSESYYYLAGAANRTINPNFTVEDIYHEDVYGHVFCYDGFTVRANIYSPYNSIFWEVTKDGATISGYANGDYWIMPKEVGSGKYFVRMTVNYTSGDSKSVETEFTMNNVVISHEGSTTLDIDDTLQLTGTGGPAGLTGIWVSDNPSVATINENGLVTAVSVGDANILLIYNGCPAVIPITVADICPPITVWTGSIDSDWDKEINWYPNKVPKKCTDVYIPGNVNIFPSLISSGTNKCKNIYFLPGGQLGQPQFLDYDSAHVQLDLGRGSLPQQAKITDNAYFVEKGPAIDSKDRLEFGAGNTSGALDRNRFYMLSAPLKSVWTGDVAFGGYPFTYVRKFDSSATKEDGTSFIAGRWSNYYSATTEEFQAAEGFVYWVNEYRPATMRYLDNNEWPVTTPAGMTKRPTSILSSENFGLAEVNGILHLPYYKDNYMSTAHRNHITMEEESIFFFFLQSPTYSPDFMQFTGNVEARVREDAYRFIAETANGSSTTMNVEYDAGTLSGPSAGEFILVGNPYMSALDFAQFYNDNSSLIKPYYQIWNGSEFDVITNNAKIAPMQSFLVELKENLSGDIKFDFNVANVAVTDNSVNLKSSEEETKNNCLTIKAVNEFGTISTQIIKSDDARDDFCDKDICKIIEYPISGDIPEIYSLASVSGTNNRKALVYNYIKSDDITISLGMATAYSGDMKLKLTGMRNYEGSIVFVDLLETPSGIDITGMDDFEYSFSHSTATTQNEDNNIVENRFLIRISSQFTDLLEPVSLDDLKAYVYGNDIFITSSSKIIDQIFIYDAQGYLLYQQNGINELSHKAEGVSPFSGIYLIKVRGKSGMKVLKVIK